MKIEFQRVILEDIKTLLGIEKTAANLKLILLILQKKK